METAVAWPTKYKRRRVSSVRDFPVGCGPGVKADVIELEEFEWRNFSDDMSLPSPAASENSLVSFIPDKAESLSVIVVKMDIESISSMEPPKLVHAAFDEDVTTSLHSPDGNVAEESFIADKAEPVTVLIAEMGSLPSEEPSQLVHAAWDDDISKSLRSPDGNRVPTAVEGMSGVPVESERMEILDLLVLAEKSPDHTELQMKSLCQPELDVDVSKSFCSPHDGSGAFTESEGLSGVMVKSERREVLDLPKNSSHQLELQMKSLYQPELLKENIGKLEIMKESCDPSKIRKEGLVKQELSKGASGQLEVPKESFVLLESRKLGSDTDPMQLLQGKKQQLEWMDTPDQPEQLVAVTKEDLNVNDCYPKRNPLPWKRKVPAIRDFPIGCGSASHMTRKENLEGSVSTPSKWKSLDATKEHAMNQQLAEYVPSGVQGISFGAMVEECRNGQTPVKPRSERMFKKRDVSQLTLSCIAKETCASMPSPDSGSLSKKKLKFVIKVGNNSVGEPDIKKLLYPRADATGLRRKTREQFGNEGDVLNNEAGEGGQTIRKQRKSWKKFVFTEASGSCHWDEVPRGDYVPLVVMEQALTSFPPGNHNSVNIEVLSDRQKVKRVLRMCQHLCRKFLQEKEARPKELGRLKRVDLRAADVLKQEGQFMNKDKKAILGVVPGVEVGDEFQFRVELSLVGLHRQYQGGIDSTKLEDGTEVATSIVASGGYPDEMDDSSVLIYTGSGGNPSVCKKGAGDQILRLGNLALKNSIDAKTPVRVIYGSKEQKVSDIDAEPKMGSTFTYDGLYLVERYWTESGSNGFSVFKFQLRRIPGQRELGLKEVIMSKKTKVRKGLCIKDITDGKERRPICAVNTVDDELPMPFKYITENIYPSWHVQTPPSGCGCKKKCSESSNCACAVKNGGCIPFTNGGALVDERPIMYECGPSCKCPPSCYNRVSQHGIQIPLELFKTDLRGWGVRSLYSIPSGSFICEYIGEVLKDSDAEARTSNDQYLFDIGHKYDDKKRWEGYPLIPSVQSKSVSETAEDEGFTIDAAEYGNIGRFINHSCSPNTFPQKVVYDHDDERMPRIMLFAGDTIPPLQELTYHYGYPLDEVRDSDGNIKRKECKCGSSDCTGRLY